MLSPEKLARIKVLAQKQKAGKLTAEDAEEQKKLREEYLEVLRIVMRQHIEGIKVVDAEGNDVTPEKLKEIQRKKGKRDD